MGNLFNNKSYIFWVWSFAITTLISGVLFGRQLWFAGAIILPITIITAYQGWKIYFKADDNYVWRILLISTLLTCIAGFYKEHDSGVDILAVIAWVVYWILSFSKLKRWRSGSE